METFHRLMWALAFAGIAILTLHAQDLARVQALSLDLLAAPIPNNVSANGTLDASIPPLLAGLKHEIRNWLGVRLAFLPAKFDPAEVRSSLIIDLNRAHLIADSADHDLHHFGKIRYLGIYAVPADPDC